ncbi:MAG: hypothetical protein U1E91_04840 [Moraxella sp.]
MIMSHRLVYQSSSDWLFVLARVVARLDAGQEVLWDKNTLS